MKYFAFALIAGVMLAALTVPSAADRASEISKLIDEFWKADEACSDPLLGHHSDECARTRAIEYELIERFGVCQVYGWGILPCADKDLKTVFSHANMACTNFRKALDCAIAAALMFRLEKKGWCFDEGFRECAPARAAQ